MSIKINKVFNYLILIILSGLLVYGLFNVYINSQLGLHSIQFRFWGIFSLTNFIFLLVCFAVLDKIEKKKKFPYKARIIQRIRNFKIKNINFYKFPRIGFILEGMLLIIVLYIYLLVPYEVLEYLYTFNSPFFIFLIILITFGVALMIIGFLFGGIKSTRDSKVKDKDVSG
jgi:hypothetical protein